MLLKIDEQIRSALDRGQQAKTAAESGVAIFCFVDARDG